MIGSTEIGQLNRDGFIVLTNFYDRADEIAAIQEGIQKIVRLTAHKYGINAPASTPDAAIAPSSRPTAAMAVKSTMPSNRFPPSSHSSVRSAMPSFSAHCGRAPNP